MIRIQNKTRQLVLSGSEADKLIGEIIHAYTILDKSTDGNYYSKREMEKLYPALCELHSLLV